MRSTKVTFANDQELNISARIDLPADRAPHHYALFAHCFTCSKDLAAVRNISRTLTGSGFGVLRFDFTGLGDSEGSFDATTFGHNVADLNAAIRFMAQEYQAPSLIIGHSLGGAAAIIAGAEAASIEAVATIGAPADVGHIENLFGNQLERIEADGHAEVSIGGRPFTIRKAFLDDVRSRDLPAVLAAMRKPILIAHSPQDTVVGIGNAAGLYTAAMHPKSFLSLDGADHLLSDRRDSLYAGDMIAAWVQRYLPVPEAPALDKSEFPVVAHIGNEGYTTQLRTGRHNLTADEPASAGGNDLGPSPYDLLSAALGACTAMTMKMYAERKGWDLQGAYVHLSHGKVHAADCATCDENTSGKIDRFEREIELIGDLDDDQRKRLLEIADKCPVHRTLHSTVEVRTRSKG